MNSERKELPDGWKWVKLGDVCEINPRRPRGLDWPLDTRTTFVPMPSVDGQGGRISQPEEKNYYEVSKGYTYFEEGDILFAKITPCMQNGKHAVASDLLNGFGFGSTEFHVVRPSESILSAWVHAFLRQPSVLSDAERHFRGAVGQQRVPKEFLFELEIPLPPLEEQKRLTAILDERMAMVEKARRAAEEMMDAVDSLKNAILRELLPYLGQQLAGAWKWVRLENVCEVILGQSPPSSTYRKTPDGLPFYQGKADFGEVSPSPTTWCVEPKKIAESGDILISVRAPVGPTNIADTRCCIGRGLAALRCNPSAHRDFILAVLRLFESSISKVGSGSTFKAITGKQLRELPVPIPSLDEQKRIANLISQRMAAQERAKAAALEQLEAVEAMRPALLRQAFSGAI